MDFFMPFCPVFLGFSPPVLSFFILICNKGVGCFVLSIENVSARLTDGFINLKKRK